MAMTTTKYGGEKEWSWSYSKLKNFEVCPRRHYGIDITKKYKDGDDTDPNSPLARGKRDHDALANRLIKKTLLPPEIVDYETAVKRLEGKIVPGSKLLVEQKYAITRQFTKTGYFAKNVWYRGIADALVISPSGRVALALDWKTGRILEDSVQLALMAQCVFSFYPEVQRVGTRFAWLKEEAETDETFSREDMIRFWPAMLDRVAKMEAAAKNLDYPPTPSGMCKKYCPDVACPFHGKGSF